MKKYIKRAVMAFGIAISSPSIVHSQNFENGIVELENYLETHLNSQLGKVSVANMVNDTRYLRQQNALGGLTARGQQTLSDLSYLLSTLESFQSGDLKQQSQNTRLVVAHCLLGNFTTYAEATVNSQARQGFNDRLGWNRNTIIMINYYNSLKGISGINDQSECRDVYRGLALN